MDEFIVRTEGLLGLERKAEVEQYEEVLLTKLLNDSRGLETKGLCLTKLSVCHQHTGLYGRRIVIFKAGDNKRPKNLPCNRFATGTCVDILRPYQGRI